VQPTPIATGVFVSIVGFIVIAIVAAYARSAQSEERRTAVIRGLLVAGAWLLITAIPTLTGHLSEEGRFPPQLFMILVLGAAVAFALSRTAGSIARSVPLWAIIGFQGFRLPLELVLHRWAEAGVAPPQMTWTGQNPDILTGVLALLFIPIVHRRQALAWVPTLVGLALLLNIGRIVLTSLPGPLMSFPDPITLPMRFPHVWIASVGVAAALAAHIVAIRALRTTRSRP